MPAKPRKTRAPVAATTSQHPLIALDPWLKPYAAALQRRHDNLQRALQKLADPDGSLNTVSSGHRYFGFNRGECHGTPGVWYREWAPGAKGLFLIGDFNGWQRQANPLTRDEFGVWHLFLPEHEFAARLVHGSLVKVHVHGADDSRRDRIPAYIRRVVQDPATKDFVGQFWMPSPYSWQHATPRLAGAPLIYETHVGMAQEEATVGSFSEFQAKILPRIVAAGYNTLQIMAILEHPYYGSFGYHVSNFFAVSSRFGTPEELKALIDAAHGAGVHVLLDIVHSHFVKNVNDGLNRFDGTSHQYTHDAARGEHPAWDSMLFDYSKYEVQRFLLSNLRFWLEDFRFDGFRFDGVTSMMYLDHGLGKVYTSYDDYFGPGKLDEDAIVYLQLANRVAHEVNPQALTIGEDVSGMPGTARSVADDGIGFDYRLAMGVPDYWIKVLKERRDEDWPLEELYHTLINRRFTEKHIAYAESHDQALVGDKTIAFRLMDADMYSAMDNASHNPVVDRGVALHKLIRLVTFALGGEGYLTFMGNEFGHPEWIDFPRVGNNYSHHYARRQWSLRDNGFLRYGKLARFDADMLAVGRAFDLLRDPFIERLLVHEADKILAFRRGPAVFIFNFHPTQSLTDYRIPVPDPTDYAMVLNSDDPIYAGHGSVRSAQTYVWQDVPWGERKQSIQTYLPSRSAQVLMPVALARPHT